MDINLNFPPAISKSWMPTLAGLISAGASFVLFAGLGGFVQFPRWAMAFALFAQSGALAAFGVVTKQFNVTGGNVGQPSTPEALHAANQAPSLVNPPVLEKPTS